MKKIKKRRSFRRFFRLIGTLLLICFLSFLLKGSSSLFSPQDTANVNESPLVNEQTSSTENKTDSMLSRMKRIIFLKRAVRAHINRENYTPIDKIPKEMQYAIVAVEDRKFYTHYGFDLNGIARASLVNFQHGKIEEGASTITQQLVKNLFLSHEQSFGRKAEELILALDMEVNYSKDEILELYLNTIYYGSNFYGIGNASKGYFGKKPSELALPEEAMLAGLPNAPSLYSPYVDFIMAKKRQFVVLDAMVSAGYIDNAMAEDAKIKPITLKN